jgi:selenophosphate synthetase-related protein
MALSSREDRLLAGRQVFAKLMVEHVAAVNAAIRGVVEPGLSAKEAVAGELLDGTPIGRVSLSKAPTSAAVTDEREMLKWVKQHRPDEIVESVNPAFVTKLKGYAKTHGVAVLPTGEIVPGVESVQGNPRYRVDVDPDAVPILRARLAELVAQGLLELPEETAS